MARAKNFVVNVRSYSSGVPGRSLCNARNHHWVEDEPVGDSYGEAINAAELLMSGVTSCAVTLIEAAARKSEFPLKRAEVTLEAIKDREAPPVHEDVTVFNEVHLQFDFVGIDDDQANELVELYKRR